MEEAPPCIAAIILRECEISGKAQTLSSGALVQNHSDIPPWLEEGCLIVFIFG